MSLIVSFCSIKPRRLPFLSIFLHAFLVGSPFDRFVSSFVFLTVRPLNQTTTDAQQNPESFRVANCQSGCRKCNGNCFLKSCKPRIKNTKFLSPLEKARKRRSLEGWSGPLPDTRTSKFGSRHIPKFMSSRRQPGFRWASVVIWFSGRTVRNTDELTNRMAIYQKSMEKYG